MIFYKHLVKLFIAVTFVCFNCALQGQILTAFQVNNRYDLPMGHEGGSKILNAKTELLNAGSMVYFYWLNQGDKAHQLVNLQWNGKDYEYWQSAEGSYLAIWRVARPETVLPGTVGEFALCLRSAFEKPTSFELTFDDGSHENVLVQPKDAPARFSTIAFSADLKHARCFIEGLPDGPSVKQITVDGKQAEVTWWCDEPVNDLRIAELTFKSQLTSGERLTFLAKDRNGVALTGASLRVFNHLATLGTFGNGELLRYVQNGLDSFNSFDKVPKSTLDAAHALHMRIVSSTSSPEPDSANHPALYAYVLCDEPDCVDYEKWPERPVNLRLGGCAPEMLQYYSNIVKLATEKPAMLTLDLTFTPFNYFVYAPLADISNPDIYTNTYGWNVKYISNHLKMVKRAAAPRPFSFTYQSCWEEWSNLFDHWVGKEEVLEKGFDFYRDTTRAPRGFGVNTNPDEIAIAMHYAILNGATALFAYIDATETGGGLLFHGTDVLPENWETVGKNARKIAQISSLLCPAHPMTLARGTGTVQIGTLLADRDNLLVVAVNENYQYGNNFTISASQTTITLPLPPWLDGKSVLRVTPNGFEPVDFQTDGDELRWNALVQNGEIFLVSSTEAAAKSVMAAAAERERLIKEAMLSAPLR